MSKVGWRKVFSYQVGHVMCIFLWIFVMLGWFMLPFCSMIFHFKSCVNVYLCIQLGDTLIFTLAFFWQTFFCLRLLVKYLNLTYSVQTPQIIPKKLRMIFGVCTVSVKFKYFTPSYPVSKLGAKKGNSPLFDNCLG